MYELISLFNILICYGYIFTVTKCFQSSMFHKITKL